MIRQSEIPVMIRIGKGEESRCDVLRSKKDGTVMFDVHVEKCRKDEQTIARLTHEFGHLVAQVMQTDANCNDPRYYKPFVDQMTPTERAEMYEVEREAWEFARRIWPTVSRAEERNALAEYLR